MIETADMNNFALNVVKPDLSTGEVYLRVRKEIMPPEPDGSSAGSVLEYELPIAFDVIQNVCRIYGDSAYLGERRLVSVLVDNALQAYENLIYRTNSLESTQAMRLAVFVSSLVTQIAEVSKCRIKCASGGMWNRCSVRPLRRSVGVIVVHFHGIRLVCRM